MGTGEFRFRAPMRPLTPAKATLALDYGPPAHAALARLTVRCCLLTIVSQEAGRRVNAALALLAQLPVLSARSSNGRTTLRPSSHLPVGGGGGAGVEDALHAPVVALEAATVPHTLSSRPFFFLSRRRRFAPCIGVAPQVLYGRY